jgi:hypothetical protein
MVNADCKHICNNQRLCARELPPFEQLNHFLPKRAVMWPYDPRPRRLGAGGALTDLRFAPLARLRPVLGYNVRLSVFQVHGWKSADCRTRDNKEGGRL